MGIAKLIYPYVLFLYFSGYHSIVTFAIGIMLDYPNQTVFMKKVIALLILLLVGSADLPTSGAQEADSGGDSSTVRFRKVNNTAFQPGEVLKFRLHYGFINAGIGELRIKEGTVRMANKDCWHIVATGRSINSFDWFYKVRDTYESYIDKEAIMPWAFARDVYEGGYVFKDFYQFDHYQKKVTTKGVEHKVPLGVQDIVSSFYYARTIDFTNAQKGDIFEVPMFLDELHNFKFKFLGRFTLKTETGTYKVMKFMPVVMKGRVFKSDEDLIVYVSDDANKIPLEIKANILVGAVRMSLTGYEGLRNPMTSKIR